MIHLNEIPFDFEPQKKIVAELSEHKMWNDTFALMSEFELAFLCGLLKTFHPKKILEVGTAAGGSTAIILQALEDLGERYEMHSVDVAEKFYLDKTKPAGFLAKFALENNLFTPPPSILNGKHELRLGKILPQVIDEIGGGIDFVILDTVHRLPGEVLDFLAVLPYLTDDAVIVLHDVALNQHQFKTPNCNATTVLFSVVTAEKFLNFLPDEWLLRYPNIAAFKINEQTAANVENIFLSLILRWSHFSEDQLAVYRQHYRRFYADELVEIFQEAVDLNAFNFWLAQRK